MTYNILSIIDYIFFVIFAINVLYLLIYSLAALKGQKKVKQNEISPQHRFAILIPAYKEDTVIIESANSCLKVNYPDDLYEVVVISDHMQIETDTKLREMGATVVNVNFKNSTKSKALNFAMNEIGNAYDLVIVLDADNVINPDFLLDVNAAFCLNPKIRALQTHRIAKNMNTDIAFLDSVSEEINNTIFRLGHSTLGLSAALIGSGMAFDYAFYKDIMLTIDAVGGFDKAIELKLTYNKCKIYYLDHTYVLDEKVQNSENFSKQRRRWMSAQLHYFAKYAKFIPKAIINGKIDFCDKLYQQISFPRLMLIGNVFLLSIIVSFISLDASIKWWLLLAILIFTLLISIPRKLLFNRRMFSSIFKLPYYFIIFVSNLFRLHNKTFIHTSHGINNNAKK